MNPKKMDERIQKYFQEELNAADRLAFLREVEAHEQLKKDFIEYQNTRALLNLSPQLIDSESSKKGYISFTQRLKKRNTRRFIIRTMKYAAAVVLLVSSTIMVNRFFSADKPLIAETNTLFTPAGQRAQLTLQDGTTVWLNAQSTLTYPSHFHSKERRVMITGECFFEVARDEHKPFVVSAADAEITVLGTKFNVYSYPESGIVQTSLIEGSVEVAKAGSTTAKVVLKPNEQATLQNGIMTVGKIKFADAFLWKDGIYSFDNERLEDIVKKLQLYYDVKIIIENPSLTDVRYTCKFRQRDGIDEILRIIRRIHKFKIEKDKDLNVIKLS